MAKQKRNRKPPAGPPESRVSVFVTVAWTLSVMTTLVCAGVALLVWLSVRSRGDNETALLFAGLLHFSAVVTGFASLFLLPVVFKVRPEPPPLGLVVGGVVIAVLPIAATFF